MCYEVKCATCAKTSWGGCGRHVPSVYNRIPEGQHCHCKGWPGVDPAKVSPAKNVVAGADPAVGDSSINAASGSICTIL